MCLILIAWRSHPDFPCVLAANRDEFYARPSQRAQWWVDKPQILAGRDLTAGGTWLAVSRSGRFAALTNYRDPQHRRLGTPSRGELVTSMVESDRSVFQELEHLRKVGANYSGFNLIFSDGMRLGIYESVRASGRELKAGIYGLSNHVLDTPWPKVTRAKTKLSDALSDLSHPLALLEFLRDDLPAPDADLPQTGVSLEWERLLSSAFIRAPDYGTRCSTVLRIGRNNIGYFDEWTWDEEGVMCGQMSESFLLKQR